MERYRYYSVERPIMPGSFPRRQAATEIVNYDDKIYCDSVGRAALGHIDYAEPLTEEEIKNYELVPDPTLHPSY